MVAQAGAGGGLVEDLDDLGAEAAGELPVPAEGVLPGDPALLVGGGAQRQVGLAEQPVVGDDAVPGGEHVRQAGAHLPVDGDRALERPARRRRSAARSVSGRTPTTTRTMSASAGHRRAVGGGGVDPQPPGLAGSARLICRTVVPVSTSTPCAGQFGVDQGAECGVDGGQHLGQLFHLGDRQAAGGQGVGHFQADVPGADDDRGGRGGGLRGCASPRRCRPSSAAGAPRRRGRARRGRPGRRSGGGPGPRRCRRSACRSRAGPPRRPGSVTSELSGGQRRCGGRWCPAAAASRWLPGRRWCGGPGCASG